MVKISREHLFSKSILHEFRRFSVQGFSWCRNDLRSIGKAAFVAKHLCRAHNTVLSPTDSAAFSLFRGLRRIAMKKSQHDGAEVHIDGHVLERWFLKTAINVTLTEAEPPTWGSGTTARYPSRDVVEKAFGLTMFQPPTGLYVYPTAGIAQDALSIEWYHEGDGAVSSIFARVRGCAFLVSLDPKGYPMKLENDSIVFGPSPEGDFYYRPDGIGVLSPAIEGYALRLDWHTA